MNGPISIKVGGTELDEQLLSAVVEARIEQAVSLADRLTLRIADPQLVIVDGEAVDVGAEVIVHLAAWGASEQQEVFTGQVVSIEASFDDLGGVEARIVAFDASHRLRRRTQTRAFRNVTVGDVAHRIAGDHGLTIGRVDATGSPFVEVVQRGESDWVLLERLSDEAGCDIDVDQGELRVVKRAGSGSAVKLKVGENLLSFTPRLSGVAQVDRVEVRSWDAEQKQVIVEHAEPQPSVSSQRELRGHVASALGGGEVAVVDRPAESSSHASTMASAAADRLGAGCVEGAGRMLGDPALRAGGLVSLAGVGKRFGGEHRVVAATHRYRTAGGYETSFTIGSGGRPLAEEFDRPHRRPGFAAHLAIALVTQNKDPDNQGRVKLKYPALDDQLESDWVRIAWPAAGSSRGIVAIPEIDDEVVVGFEHGDIERPFVLGVLFNGKDRPGSELVAQSSSIAVRMPRDLDTGVDGKVKTTAKTGIEMSSEGPVKLQSQDKFQITATAPIEITSEATAKLSSMSTTVESQGAGTITAEGALSIKSNGTVTISGASIELSATGVLALAGAQVVLG